MISSHLLVMLGSLNADISVNVETFPEPGETITGGDSSLRPGGKSANQAVCASLLGANVAIFGTVGMDSNGDMLLENLRQAGVDVNGIARTYLAPTGTAMITVDRNAENTIVVSPGANAHTTETLVSANATILRAARVVCLALEVPVSTVLAAARLAHAGGATTILNLSPFEQIGPELIRLADILLLNEGELESLLGFPYHPDTAEQVLAALSHLGASQTIVTLGSAGAVIFDSNATDPTTPITHVPAPSVAAVDTIGCGDAFTGALATEIAAGQSTARAAKKATHVAAVAATRHGAQSSYPTWQELQPFLNGNRQTEKC
ncbi:hypothetical protein AL755_03025 (plasmid) [Arthrobacter sp. ERGS1:01]|uniref:ribokinase n=1 Tax=Arthrobacter sp. ERGS1:01 TaxID=1704044 RepID=UPI0006B63666|nr:ribokinase [Arthrobacter sp. ERGS1:01]ALE04618.1 hypothetical protein AL755_03025 [Arthrobacter sp. ERGS1:01]